MDDKGRCELLCTTIARATITPSTCDPKIKPVNQVFSPCCVADIKDIISLLEMDDEERRELLCMANDEYSNVASFCNRYPDIQLAFTVTNAQDRSETDAEGEEVKRFVADGDTDEVRTLQDLAA